MIKPDKKTYKTVDRFYGHDYQLIVAVLLSKEYQQVKSLQRVFFEAAGYPIPVNGFSDRLDYIAWQDRVHIHHNPYKPVRFILNCFSLDVTNRIYKDFVNHEFYFNEILNDPVFEFVPISNGPHTYLEIFPWTTADHLKDNFYQISRTFLRNYQQYYATFKNADETTKFDLEIVDEQCLIKIFPWTTGNDLKNGFKSIVKSFNEKFSEYKKFKKVRIKVLKNFKHQVELYYLYREYRQLGLRGEELAIAFTESPAYSAINDKYEAGQDDYFEITRTMSSKFDSLLESVDFSLPDQTS